jgi:hypothetical protein
MGTWEEKHLTRDKKAASGKRKEVVCGGKSRTLHLHQYTTETPHPFAPIEGGQRREVEERGERRGKPSEGTPSNSRVTMHPHLSVVE